MINRTHRSYKVIVFTQKMMTNYGRVLVENMKKPPITRVRNETGISIELPERIRKIV